MKEDEDYVIAQDPESLEQTSWVVILKKGLWENFVIRFKDIEITNEGQSIKFVADIIFKPDEIELGEQTQDKLRDYCGLVIADIILDFHDRGVNTYIDKKTGKQVEL